MYAGQAFDVLSLLSPASVKEAAAATRAAASDCRYHSMHMCRCTGTSTHVLRAITAKSCGISQAAEAQADVPGGRP